MIAIKKVNPSLKGVLPKDCGRPALNAVMLGEGKDKARDLLGRVNKYFLGQLAGSEDKRGGDGNHPDHAYAACGGQFQQRAVDVADEEQVEDLQHHERVYRHGLSQGERVALVDGIGEDAEDRRQK